MAERRIDVRCCVCGVSCCACLLSYFISGIRIMPIEKKMIDRNRSKEEDDGWIGHSSFIQGAAGSMHRTHARDG